MNATQIAEAVAIVNDLKAFTQNQRSILSGVVASDPTNDLVKPWANNLPILSDVLSLFSLTAAIPQRPQAA